MKLFIFYFLCLLTILSYTVADDYDYFTNDTDISRSIRDNGRYIQNHHEFKPPGVGNQRGVLRRKKLKPLNQHNQPNSHNQHNHPNNNPNNNHNQPNNNPNPNNNYNQHSQPNNNNPNPNNQGTSYADYYNNRNVKSFDGLFNQKDINDLYLKGNYDYDKLLRDFNRQQQPPNEGDKNRYAQTFVEGSPRYTELPENAGVRKKKQRKPQFHREESVMFRPHDKKDAYNQQPQASENIAVVVSSPPEMKNQENNPQWNGNQMQNVEVISERPHRIYGEKINSKRRKKPYKGESEIKDDPQPIQDFQSFDMVQVPYMESVNLYDTTQQSQQPQQPQQSQPKAFDSTPYSVDIYDANSEILKLYPSNANANANSYQQPLTTSASKGHDWESDSFKFSKLNVYDSQPSTSNPFKSYETTSQPPTKYEWSNGRFKLNNINGFDQPSTSSPYKNYESTTTKKYDWNNERYKLSDSNIQDSQGSTSNPVKSYEWNPDSFKLSNYDSRLSTSNPFGKYETTANPFKNYDSTTNRFSKYEFSTTQRPIINFSSPVNVFNNQDTPKIPFDAYDTLSIKHSDGASSNSYVSYPFKTSKPENFQRYEQESQKNGQDQSNSQDDSFKTYQSPLKPINNDGFKPENVYSSFENIKPFQSSVPLKNYDDKSKLESEIKNTESSVNIDIKAVPEYRSSTASYFTNEPGLYSTMDPLKAYENTLSNKKYNPVFNFDQKSPFNFDKNHGFSDNSKFQSSFNSRPQFNFETKPQFNLEPKPQFNFEPKPQFNFETKPQFNLEQNHQFNFNPKPQQFDFDNLQQNLNTKQFDFDQFSGSPTTPMYNFAPYSVEMPSYVSEFDMKGNPLSPSSTFSPIEGDPFASNYDKKLEMDLTKVFYNMNKLSNSPYTSSFTLDDVKNYAPNFSFAKDYSTLNINPLYQNSAFGSAFNKYGQGAYKDLSAHASINMQQPILIPVPQPYPVKVPVAKPVAVPFIKEIKVPIEKEVPYPVYKNVPYPIEKPVPVPVEKQIPVPVEKPFPVKIPIIKNIYHHANDMDSMHQGDEVFDYEEEKEHHHKPKPAKKPRRPQRHNHNNHNNNYSNIPVTSYQSTKINHSRVRWPAKNERHQERDHFHDDSDHHDHSSDHHWDSDRGQSHRHHYNDRKQNSRRKVPQNKRSNVKQRFRRIHRLT